jgi:hypothetical protein
MLALDHETSRIPVVTYMAMERRAAPASDLDVEDASTRTDVVLN